MMIEHVETGRWYSRYMEGKVDDEPVEKTTWAYEFNASSSPIEVLVDVPDTLDMYEARIYVMTNPKEKENLLNGMPLPWEDGLYGNTQKSTVDTIWTVKASGILKQLLAASILERTC